MVVGGIAGANAGFAEGVGQVDNMLQTFTNLSIECLFGQMGDSIEAKSSQPKDN